MSDENNPLDLWESQQPPDPDEDVSRRDKNDRLEALSTESGWKPNIPEKFALRGFVEYTAPNGDEWRCERGVDLIGEFGLEGTEQQIGSLEGSRPSQAGSLTSEAALAEQLKLWHAALAPHEPAWSILCRLYGNAPLYGVEDPDELRPWSVEELAKARGLTPEEITAHVDGAKTFWKRWRLSKEQGAGSRESGIEPVGVVNPPDEDETERLLDEQGFVEVENSEERKYIASRIKELRDWLENESTRAGTRSMIQQEVGIFFVLDPTIRDLRKKIRTEMAKPGRSSLEKENQQLLALLKQRGDMQQQLDSSSKAIGLNEGSSGSLRKKLAFNDCLGTLVKALQVFYSDDSRALIDGIFTAAEVELLTTPTELRPVQYRPDLIVTLHEAKAHLWERDWSPTPLSRRACRKLAEGFKHGIALVSDAGRADAADTAATTEDVDEVPVAETPSVPIAEDRGSEPDGRRRIEDRQDFQSRRVSKADEVAVAMT
jgi:hypothetical protein